MTLFDYLYTLSLHNAYANAIPVICKSVETIVITLSAMVFAYKMYLIVFITDTTQNTKKQTELNDYVWHYEEYNSKPVQKEENKMTDTETPRCAYDEFNKDEFHCEEYNIKPVQKEENTDGKCKPESNTSNADSKH